MWTAVCLKKPKTHLDYVNVALFFWAIHVWIVESLILLFKFLPYQITACCLLLSCPLAALIFFFFFWLHSCIHLTSFLTNGKSHGPHGRRSRVLHQSGLIVSCAVYLEPVSICFYVSDVVCVCSVFTVFILVHAVFLLSLIFVTVSVSFVCRSYWQMSFWLLQK